MRSLSDTLTARQKAKSYIAVLKATLTKGATTHTYDLTRIKDLDHTEQPYQQKAEIVLNNSDGALTALDLKGYKLVLSYGMRTPAGEETSDAAPLYVIGQTLQSQEGSLICVLTAIGLSNILAEDKANDSYIPASSDTKTVKTIIGEIMAGTMTCFNHCPAYDVVWDSEDSLIDTYQPKDGFRIYIGGSRMAAIRRLLDYTKCVGRFESDGKFHVRLPTTTGTTYDYEYTLEAGHTFFAKAYRKALVLPNYVIVQSMDDDSPQYSGYYTDAESIAAFREVRDYIQTRLASNAQAMAIATAVISKYQMQAKMGSADVPMNCGAELFDYVKVTDSREGDYRVGNLGSIRRYWRKGMFRMSFSFGGWLSVKGLMSDLEVNSDVGSSIIRTSSKGQNIYLDDIKEGTTYKRTKSVAIDANGMVILDQTIAGTYGLVLTADISAGHIKLDSIEDGTTYKKVLASQISAGKLNLTSACTYAAGYDPSGKRRVFIATPTTPYDVGDLWFGASTVKRCTTARESGAYNASDWTATTLDAISDGSSYGRVLATQISAGEIVLTSTAVMIDKNGVVTGTAGSTRVELKSTGLRGYNGATLQFEIKATDGKAYFGAGTCYLDASGIFIEGVNKSLIIKSGSNQARFHCSSVATLYIDDIEQVYFISPSGVYFKAGVQVYPSSSNGYLGSSDISTFSWSALSVVKVGLKQTTTPSTVAGFGLMYCKSDNKLYFKDGGGTEHEIAFV